MEFELKYTKAQDEFRNEVRAWLAANVPDGITARPRSFEESRAIYLLRRELGRKLGAKGWLYPSGEKTFGGGGLDLDQIIVLEEETARLGLGLPPYYDSGGKMGSASIRVWGTEEQKQRFLPPIYRGAVRSWQLLTEPSAGAGEVIVDIRAAGQDEDDHQFEQARRGQMTVQCADVVLEHRILRGTRAGVSPECQDMEFRRNWQFATGIVRQPSLLSAVPL